jgi:uncharacterized protein YdbL (DUF1318 family)
MKTKFFLAFAVFALSLASAKSFSISVDSASQAGSLQLKPGEYKVSIDGAKVKFTDVNSGKSEETNATIESNGKTKYDATALETEQVKGVTKINEIDLGGTPTKIKFQ